MSRFRRMLPLLAVLLGIAALVTPMTLARAEEPVPQIVHSGVGFTTTTTTWENPGHFSSPGDVSFGGNGPARHLGRPRG